MAKNTVKTMALFAIKVYRFMFSPFFAAVFGAHCRYSITCSQFAEKAIREQGVLKAAPSILKRILSCNPWVRVTDEAVGREKEAYGK